MVEDQRFTADTAESQTKDSYVGTLEDAVLHNTNQFHKWHAELEAACASEMEEKYKRYADLLNNHLKLCDGILSKVRMLVACGRSCECKHASRRGKWGSHIP